MDVVGIFEEADALARRVGRAAWRVLRSGWARAGGIRGAWAGAGGLRAAWARVDPASGWVLREGCVPWRGAALEGYARPDDRVRTVCPARPGERWRRAGRDRDAWHRLRSWLDDIF